MAFTLNRNEIVAIVSECLQMKSQKTLLAQVPLCPPMSIPGYIPAGYDHTCHLNDSHQIIDFTHGFGLDNYAGVELEYRLMVQVWHDLVQTQDGDFLVVGFHDETYNEQLPYGAVLVPGSDAFRTTTRFSAPFKPSTTVDIAVTYWANREWVATQTAWKIRHVHLMIYGVS